MSLGFQGYVVKWGTRDSSIAYKEPDGFNSLAW